MKSHSQIRTLVLSSALVFVAHLAQATTYYWTNGNNANLNWSYAPNWSPNGPPGSADTAIFNSSNAFTAGGGLSPLGGGTNAISLANFNNIVDSGFGGAIASLTYSNTGANYNNTYLADGVTLNVTNTGGFVCGSSSLDLGQAATLTTIAGTNATLNVSNTNAIFFVGLGSVSGATPMATLDMSALQTFNATVGRFMVGVAYSSISTQNHPGGILYLAATNTITAEYQTGSTETSGTTSGVGAIIVGDAASNAGGDDYLYLGQNNTISADTICVSKTKETHGLIQFNPIFSNPTATFGGFTNSRVTLWSIGDGTSSTGTSTCSGTDDFSLGTVNAQVITLYVGRASSAVGTSSGTSTGTLTIGNGTFNVNTANVGYQATTDASKIGVGTLNVESSGGALVVNGNLNIANCTAANATKGTLNITNGSVWASNIVAGAGTSTINIFGGSLITTNSAGTTAGGLSNLRLSNAVLTVSAAAGVAPFVATNVTADYSATDTTTINVTALPTITGFPATLALIQSPNQISLQNGSFSFALAALPSGYKGYITNNTANTAVNLVVTSGPQSASAWSGADIIPNQNTNWSDTANWSSEVVPGPNSLVVFNSSSAQASSALVTPGGGPGAILPSKLNNIVNGNFTVASLLYTNTGGKYENTSISANDILSSGFMEVGSPAVDFGNTTGNVTLTGALGTLDVASTASSFYVGLGSSTPGSTPQATLDMSGLGTFISSNANWLVGVGGYSVGSYTLAQPSGVVYLAETNVIYAASSQTDSSDSSPVALEVGDADTLAGLPSTLFLGWNNAIYADNIATARQLASGGIFFNPAFTNANPTVSIQGFSASPVANWIIGDGAANTTTTLASSGTNDFTGGTVNALANTLWVGKSSSGQYASGQTAGTLNFNSGTINVNNLNVSYNSAASDGYVYDTSAGTVNVGGTGLLVVNTTLNLAYMGGNQAYGTTPYGTLNITNGGTVWANAIVAGTNGGDSILSVNEGTLIVSNTAGTSSAPLSSLDVTNAILDLVVGSSPAAIEVNTINAGGVTNTVNILSLPALVTYPITFTVIQSANGINGYNFGLGSLPSASPSYAASITENADQNAVLLTITSGPVGVRPSVVWDGNDSATTVNWSDGMNWEFPGAPVATDNVIFNDSAVFNGSTDGGGLSPVGGGPGAIISGNFNNIVDSAFSGTISSLTYSNIVTDYNTYLANGVTLNVTGSNGFVCGSSSLSFANVNALTTIAGTNATLNVNNTSAIFFVGLGGGPVGPVGTLDMSALQTFNATVSQFMVGAAYANYLSQNVPGGILYLAATNTITAGYQTTTEESSTTDASDGAIVVGDSADNGGLADYLYLGQNNTIIADTICVGMQKCTHSLIQFNPVFSNPIVSFAGFTTDRVAVWDIGDGTANSGTTITSGTNDFSLGTVNAQVNTLHVGRAAGASTGGGAATGTLTLGNGTFNINNAYVGDQPVANGSKTGTGTINLISSGGTLVVNNTLYLPYCATAGAATGTLNITNGTVLASNIVCGLGTSTINMYGGVVVVTNTVGGAGAPLTTLNLSPSTANSVSNLLQIAPAGTTTAAVTVNNLAIDGMSSTTNVINLSAMPPITAYPVEIPLIQYASFNQGAGTFNIGLGAFPVSRTRYVGVLTNDTASNTIAVLVSSGPLPQPPAPTRITSFSLSGTTLSFSGTNGVPNGPYVVLTSTNLAQGWTPVVTNSFDASGNFNYSAAYGSSDHQRFYTIEQP
jgi:hypothetical protein